MRVISIVSLVFAIVIDGITIVSVLTGSSIEAELLNATITRYDPGAYGFNSWTGEPYRLNIESQPKETATRTPIPTHNSERMIPLRDLAAKHDLYIGAAITLFDDPDYLAIAKREFNIITPEWLAKFGPLRPARDEFYWDDLDELVDWAEENDMRVHGHTLVWHEHLAHWNSWLNEEDFTPQEIEAILEEHIKTVVGRYKGRIHEWDVVNEAFDDAGDLRDTIWLRAIGPDYIAKAFQWAHEADPQAVLYYNDYGAETGNLKTAAIYSVVADLIRQGVPIHGVGFQYHLTVDQLCDLTVEEMQSVMDYFSNLGLQVAVTELDVQISSSHAAFEDQLYNQAELFGRVLQACLNVDGCHTFIIWGVTDRYTWRNYNGAKDWPLLFDENLQPKPAYFAIADGLRGE